MASKSLIEKIEALPVEKKAEVEDFVDFLRSRPSHTNAARSGESLVERLRAQRAELFRRHGLFDSLPHIREFRETGGR
jgi:hypothetical protein